MQNDQKKEQSANENPAVHQQPNVRENEALQMNINTDPRANENLTDKPEDMKSEGGGVGSEITDGEAG